MVLTYVYFFNLSLLFFCFIYLLLLYFLFILLNLLNLLNSMELMIQNLINNFCFFVMSRHLFYIGKNLI
jgi:hypothetical protein